jgi:hypothetical protein
MITRTKLSSPAYDGAIKPLLAALGKDGEAYRQAKSEGLTLLRATVMNPFSVDANPDYLLGLTETLRQVVMSFLETPAEGQLVTPPRAPSSPQNRPDHRAAY